MSGGPSRRAVLSGAAVGIAAAGLRGSASASAAGGSDRDGDEYDGTGLDPTLTAPPLPVPANSALHLLRRVTHGPAPVDWEALTQAGGLTEYLDAQLADMPDVITDAQVRTRFPYAELPPAAVHAALGPNWDPTAMRQVALAHTFRQLVSSRQLYEQVVDVFYNRLNVPANGEDGPWSLPDYYAQVIRKHAYGKYADMVLASATHGAMLDYLSASESTKHNPNENLGRELLELHTVGLGARYTETDVKKAALALTGLTTAADGSMTYNAASHYVGGLRVLRWAHPNKTAAGGQAVVASLVNYLTRHPACARRVASALATRFVCDKPPRDLLDAMQHAYLANDTAIVPTLRAMFAHKAFEQWKGRKLRRPHQQALAAARCLSVGADPAQPTGTDGTSRLWFSMGSLGDAPLTHAAPDGHPDLAMWWLSTSSRLAAPRWSVLATGGWGAGLSNPDAAVLRPTDSYATQGAVWSPATSVTPRQLVQACARRMLGQSLPSAQVDIVVKGVGLSPTAPPALLISYDAALEAIYALLAAHPQHTVR
ncbi:MAG: hypothetical protein QOJ92_3003 [Frankiales bacterium]|nr:hypothetical protein [Frankiales bacterium]